MAKANRFKNPCIACFGLAFKADIDDLRESPALDIAATLAAESEGRVLMVEPNIQSLPERLTALDNVELVGVDTAIDQADIVVGLVDHNEFTVIPTDRLKEKIVVDTRGMWS